MAACAHDHGVHRSDAPRRGSMTNTKTLGGNNMQIKGPSRATRISATVLAIALAGWGSAAAQEPIEFKAGISDPVNTVLAWYMARDAGFYAAQRLKVDII
jgi:hypothetical protein